MYGIIWQLEPDEGPATLCRWYLPLCSGLVLIFFHTKTDNCTQATVRDRCATLQVTALMNIPGVTFVKPTQSIATTEQT